MATWTISIGDTTLRVRSLAEDRPRKAARVLLRAGVAFVVNDKGELFASSVKVNLHYAKPDRRALRLLDGAARLGLLDKAAVAALVKLHKDREDAAQASGAAERLVLAAKQAGVALSPQQRRKVAAVRWRCKAVFRPEA